MDMNDINALAAQPPGNIHAPWVLGKRGMAASDSIIRALTKRILAQKGVISFAGGMPSPDTFDAQQFADSFNRVMQTDGKAALQYGPSDGHPPLREWIARSLSSAQHAVSAQQVVITSGSQQGLDLLGKVLLDPADRVAVETPTYLGALQSLGQYEPEFVGVESDAEGILPQALAELQRRRPCKLLYTIPTFQNPTGRTLSPERRSQLVQVCREHGLPIVEDDPYGSLDYAGRTHTPLLHAAGDLGVYLGSFSKTLSPGIRLGYMVAPEPLARKLEMAKQASDLHTSSVMQRVVLDILESGFMQAHLARCRAMYGERAEAMVAAVRRHLGDRVRCTPPQGGMFLWMSLRDGRNSMELLEQALQAGVAYVPGAPFFAQQPDHASMRLCFSTVNPSDIEEGIRRLASVL